MKPVRYNLIPKRETFDTKGEKNLNHSIYGAFDRKEVAWFSMARQKHGERTCLSHLIFIVQFRVLNRKFRNN